MLNLWDKQKSAWYVDLPFNNNNNNQAFYSQVSWDRLDMKAHKNRYKIRAKKKGKTKGDKKTKSKKEERQ
jgi:hypothetical protein